MLQKNFLSKGLYFISVFIISGTLLGFMSSPSGAMENEKDESPSHVTIHKLSDDLLAEVFSFLDEDKLGAMALISKRWKEVSERDILWKPFGKESKVAYVEYLKNRSLFTFKSIFPEDIDMKISFIYGNPNQEAVDAWFKDPTPSDIKGAFPIHLAQLHLEKNILTSIKSVDLPAKVRRSLKGIIVLINEGGEETEISITHNSGEGDTRNPLFQVNGLAPSIGPPVNFEVNLLGIIPL